MKHFINQNYYELLEVEPTASQEEITLAYQAAQEAFNPDSVATYSLFDREEDRELLLARIREAYRTLSNGRTRREYDRSLEGPSRGGKPGRGTNGGQGKDKGPRLVAVMTVKRSPLPSLVRSEGKPLDLNPGQPISGQELARLRESRRVGIQELAQRTRINKRIIEQLESDRHGELPALIYIKGFLKAYARALDLDPELLAEAYLAGMKAKP